MNGEIMNGERRTTNGKLVSENRFLEPEPGVDLHDLGMGLSGFPVVPNFKGIGPSMKQIAARVETWAGDAAQRRALRLKEIFSETNLSSGLILAGLVAMTPVLYGVAVASSAYVEGKGYFCSRRQGIEGQTVQGQGVDL